MYIALVQYWVYSSYVHAFKWLESSAVIAVWQCSLIDLSCILVLVWPGSIFYSVQKITHKKHNNKLATTHNVQNAEKKKSWTKERESETEREIYPINSAFLEN